VPGVPERLFYVSIPLEGMRAVDPSRPEPAWLVPQSRYFSVRIAFTPTDAEAAQQSMACHRTQFPDDVLQRIAKMRDRMWNGTLSLVPFRSTDAGTDIFQPD